MISIDRFIELADSHLSRDLSNPLNVAQRDSVAHSGDSILQIVAGPGSGKTTVLVLRALRHVFVEGILPEQILVTTFTRKAAQELRTRWLDWGTVLYDALSSEHDLTDIDINRCRIATLDSIVQEALTEFRIAGELAPVLADATGSLLILKREIFREVYWSNQQILNELLSRYTFDNGPPQNQGEAIGGIKRLLERLIQDRVNLQAYAQQGDAEQLIVDMLHNYRRLCEETRVFDFATLEEHFLSRLQNGALEEWCRGIRALLIDEYQDTNPLQEEIYFSLLQQGIRQAAIVGDDDQAMYRFRGGSVELFTDFAQRSLRVIGRQTKRIDMVRNFRSQPEIITFFNDYIKSDLAFQTARIIPTKPEVIPANQSGGVPVIGMFRSDEETLANDLAVFLQGLSTGNHIILGDTGKEFHLSPEGALGDAVFLSHSVEEDKYDYYNRTQKIQFPGKLRMAMQNCGLQIFNPRGYSLRSIPDVQRLLGLILLSVDPSSTLVDSVMPTAEAKFYLRKWREIAHGFMSMNPPPNDGQGLQGFMSDWQRAAKGCVVKSIPQEWPVLDLVFSLITWMPEFQSQPEHQVWLEAVTRIIASATMESPYHMQLLQNGDGNNQNPDVERSRQSLIRDALIPISENEVQVDEDIMPSVPRDRLQFMTIHQAKGLQFPLVIVDVGSRFKINSPKQRFLRFPEEISNVARMEDDVEHCLPSPIRGHRGGIDRTFDDLVRLYYVAWSRPQSVLMLVGNESGLRYSTTIRNIALGWLRDGTWPWRQSYTTRRPPVKVNPPFWEMLNGA